MRRILPVFLLTFLINSLSAQTKLIIKGKVKGDTKGFNKVYLFGDRVKEDSVVMKNGAFTFTMPWVEGAVPYIYTEHDANTIPGPAAFPLVPDGPGIIYLQLDDISRGLINANVSGNKAATDFHAFDSANRKMNDEIVAAIKERAASPQKGDSTRSKTYRELREEKLYPLVDSFVLANSNSYVGAFVLNRYLNILPTEQLEKLYNKLSPVWQQSAFGKAVGDHLSGLQLAAIGNQVKDFTLATPKGDSVKFSGLRGKYVLIDFWSSWCGPCKASFPHMKEVYRKYGGDQFEILGISIDEEKAAWLKELDKQALPWPQVLDTKKVYVNGFGVTGVPTAFLVSPEGKIMMKEIGFDKNGNGKIEQKLNELFSK